MQKMVTETHNLKTHARYESIFAILIALFVTFVVLTNTVGVKLFTLYGYTFGVNIFWYPLTFLITDITSEIYGAKRASFMVVVGFSMSVLLLFFSLLGISLPSAEFYAGDEAYVTIFGPVWRLLFASMAAYLLAQLIDVRLFHYWKKLTKGKHLWLRNNGSTIISQLIDSLTVNIIFLYKNPVVFTGDFADVLAVAMNVYVFKVLIALLDTPLCYAGVRLFEKLTGVKGDEVM